MKKFLNLIVLALIFLITVPACTTTHKVTTTTKTNVDSASVAKKDSSIVDTQIATKDDFTAKGVDVTINYDENDSVKSDTVKWTPYYKPGKKVDPMQKIVQQAIAASGRTGNISSVTVHIDSLSDNSIDSSKIKQVSTIDSSASHVITKTDSKVSDVKKTGLSFGVYVIGVIVILAFIVIAVIKFKIL